MKRFLSILLALTMVFAFASCKDKDTRWNEDSKKIEEEKEEREFVTLTWYAFGDQQLDMWEVLKEANEIIESEINAELELKIIPISSYSERMKMIMASGAEFDICFTSNWLNDYDDAAESGAYVDITDLISDDLYETMDKRCWDDMKINGKIYAVPNMQAMYTQLAVAVKADLVDKYDIDLSDVEHIEDIEPILQLLHEKEPSLYTYNNRWSTNPWTYDTYVDVSGGNGIFARRDTGEIINREETSEYVSGAKKLREWYQKGYIRSDFASNGDNNTADIIQGKYAVKVESHTPFKEHEDAFKYIYKTITKPHFTGVKSSALAISATSKNPERALELIELINTNKELCNILFHGLEGEHYDLDSNGKMVPVENSGYAQGSYWQFGNQFNSILTQGMDDDIWERTKTMNGKAEASAVTNFKLDTIDIAVDLANLISVNEEYSDFVTVLDYDTYKQDKASRQKTAGIDRIIREIESQMEDHLKRNKR